MPALEPALRTAIARARVTALAYAGVLAVAALAALVGGRPWRALVALVVGLPVVGLTMSSLRALVAVMARRSARHTAASAAAGALSVAAWSAAMLLAAVTTVGIHVVDVTRDYGIATAIPALGLSVYGLVLHGYGRRLVMGDTWLSLGLMLVLVAVALLPASIARPTILSGPAVVGGIVVFSMALGWVTWPLDVAAEDDVPERTGRDPGRTAR